MEYRRIGQSNIEVSVIIFGAWAIGGTMWGGTNEKAAIEAINVSLGMGINCIDTAPIYGLGLSEQIVGKAIKGKRDRVRIFTKCGLRVDVEEGEYFFTMEHDGKPLKVYRNCRKKRILEECDRSLKNLGTDYIDLYQIHWVDHTVPIEEAMEALDKLLEQGKILAAGVCNYSVQEIEIARKCIPIVSVQSPYSLVNRGIEADLLPYCVENELGMLVYSPLQRGLLTGKYTPAHQFPPGDHRRNNPFFKPQNIQKVNELIEKLRPIANAHNATVAQLILRWTIDQTGITAALVGARNAAQAEENAKAVQINLFEEERALIRRLGESIKLDLS